jgi:membrane associated rhomboid family serine protease
MHEAAVGHQCPECVAEGRRSQRQARSVFGAARGAGAAGYATTTLIVINVIMLVLSALSSAKPAQALIGFGYGGVLGGETPLMDRLAVIGQCQLNNGQVVPCGVADGEYHRLFTAMFMHYGAIHLLMNMWALWVLGRALESWFGSLRFIAIYLLCGLGGNVAAYLFQPGALSAGASTAIFGLFSVLFVALRRMRLSTASVVPIILINLIFTISVPGISIAGHLGGFVTGALVGAGVAYAPQRNRGPVQTATLIGALALLGLLTLWQTGQLNA